MIELWTFCYASAWVFVTLSIMRWLSTIYERYRERSLDRDILRWRGKEIMQDRSWS